MKLSAPIYKLKHLAKSRARANNVPLHQALDEVAREEGYTSWSLLAAKYAARDNVALLESACGPGALILVGARPGHGKTNLCLELVARALAAGSSSALFSFELRAIEVAERFSGFGLELAQVGARFCFDDSDAICASRIIERLADATPGTLVVIDYLQLLDQRRTNPSLQAQVEALGDFAREKQLTVVLISQIHKRFEDASNALPTREDVRLPNPLDLDLFDELWFLHHGQLAREAALSSR